MSGLEPGFSGKARTIGALGLGDGPLASSGDLSAFQSNLGLRVDLFDF